MTPGALDTFEMDYLMACLERHKAGDWGDLCAEDKTANEEDLKTGGRLFSNYKQGAGKGAPALYIITEADRSVTTLLLPDEYLVFFSGREGMLSPARVLARKVAEDLTYGWLVKVKRGWLATVNGEGELKGKFDKLRAFVGHLGEQVRFQYQGLHTRHPFMTPGRALDAAIAEVQKKITALESKHDFAWMDKVMADKAWQAFRDDLHEIEGVSAGKLIREMGGTEAFWKKYPEDKVLADAYDKARGVFWAMTEKPEKFFGPATTAFEKVMKLLYADAKELAEARAKGLEIPDESMAKEFDLYGAKVIIADPNVTPYEAQQYLRGADQAYALLGRKKLLAPWRGVFFIESMEAKQFSEEMTAAYARLGYKDMRASAGTYHSGKDAVVLTVAPGKKFVGTLVHELGHRYWFKVMRPEQRARFNSLVRTNPSAETRDLPSGWMEGGDPDFDLTKLLDDFRATLKDMSEDVYKMPQDAKPWLRAHLISRKFGAKFDALLAGAPKELQTDALDILNPLFAAIDGFDLFTDEEKAALTKKEVSQIVHDWWASDLPTAKRAFERLVAQALSSAGKVKPVSPVSDYGASSIEEAFAEAWEHYVMGEDMDRDQLESFRSVLSRRFRRRPLVRALLAALRA